MTEPSVSSAASQARRIVDAVVGAGIDLAASLPDSWLTGVIDEIDRRSDIDHVRVTREDDGVGICAGAFLGGRRAVLICQNAGLLLSANALAGFAHHHQVPLLAIAAHRGGADDEYFYQAYKGRVAEPVLAGIGIPTYRVSDADGVGVINDAARQAVLNRMPAVVLLSSRALLGDREIAG